MQNLINKMEILKNTAIDLFELNVLNQIIELIKKDQLHIVKLEIDYNIKNYNHYSNYMFFTQIKSNLE